MTMNHATVKAPGQRLFAVADWNAAHTISGGILNWPNASAITEAAAHFTIVGAGARYTRIGDAAVTAHALATNDDLFVSGRLEVKSDIMTDAAKIRMYATAGQKDAEILTYEGAGIAASVRTDLDRDQMLISPGAGLGRQLILTDVANVGKDHDHGVQTNPTFYVHSATDPDSPNTEWISMTHDVTDAVIASGKGDIFLSPVGGAFVKFGAYVISAATDSTGYILINDAGGTPRKLMVQA